MEYIAELKEAAFVMVREGVYVVIANIYKDTRKRFEDGEQIRTSVVMSVHEGRDSTLYIKTLNSCYKLAGLPKGQKVPSHLLSPKQG